MISDNLKKIYRDIHNSTPFGKRSKFPKHLREFIQEINPQTILDFGCGKGRLIETIKEEFCHISVSGYDPGNSKYDHSLEGSFFDLLISSDVLEHIEPKYIDENLNYLKSKSNFAYHLIACSPAKLILPDGRNAHLIIESKEWWRQKFITLGYKIINEDYIESFKTPKASNVPVLTKKYIITTTTK